MRGLQANVVAALTALPCAAAAQQGPRTFEPTDIAEWSAHSFEGETQYALVEIDGRQAVHARCDDSSSGLFLRREIDLTETPVLEWTWRIGATYGDIDETVEAGDDYVARIYVIDEHPVLQWRTRALSYVWSSAMPEGADWANAYAEQNHMIAVASGDANAGEWLTHRRNVRDDFRRYHGRDLDALDAIAIMSDCDDTGESGEAWFGPLRLLPG